MEIRASQVLTEPEGQSPARTLDESCHDAIVEAMPANISCKWEVPNEIIKLFSITKIG
jgi:hypothetical protein